MAIPGDLNPRARWGLKLIQEYQLEQVPPTQPPEPTIPMDLRGPIRRGPIPVHRKRKYAAPVIGGDESGDQLKVGIIGAGCAGLYTAMLLDWLNIDYEILEASDRNGGRIHTYRFPVPKTPGSEWAYFDLGAMRYPDIPIMSRTFDLFKRLGLGDTKNPTKEDKLIPYLMNAYGEVLLYNGVRQVYRQNPPPPPPSGDVFNVGINNGGTVPESFVNKGYSYWTDESFGPFKQALARNWNEGWKTLMRYDHHSARTFMGTKVQDPSEEPPISKDHYPNPVVNWCETMEMGTGMYDSALSEMVIDSLEFDWPGGIGAKYEGGIEPDTGVNWYCIAGGSEVFIDKMVETIKRKPERTKRVTQIRPTENAATLSVQVAGEAQPRTYGQVISSIPLSAVRLVDLTGCNLTYAQNEAIRTLRYDASVKIGLRFKYRWWQDDNFLKDIGVRDGKSNTDRVVRCVVYPSYGIDDPNAAGVLMASYSWAQDASRLGALCRGHGTAAEEYLVDQVLRDLATLHAVPVENLRQLLEDYKCWDWYDDPYAIGAFALFGPGQFKHVYPPITQAAGGGRLHFVGEATSVQHAWVVGALDSAMRGVIHMLHAEGRDDDVDRLIKEWGPVREVDLELAKKQVLYGSILTSGVEKLGTV